ncbi:MAG: Pyruvate carboxyltransferase protein [Thermoproteota archaeon]|nr:Pyruvate carboxyltransferase protein [Thermoproteota archaeon]
MVAILDSTFREGELQPGIYYSKEARVKVGRALAEVGTPRIEFPIMYPSRGGKIEDIKAAVDDIQGCFSNSIAVLHVRVLKEDVELARVYDAKGCCAYMAPTGLHRKGKFHGMEQQKVIDNFVSVLDLMKKYGFSYRRATVEDASRFASPEERTKEDTMSFLARLLKAIEEAGATIVSIPDTSGLLPPSLSAPFIKNVRKLTRLPLACHFHNDYGNALGNALQASTMSGVDEVNVSILGLGTRNGITDHYEFVANMEDLYGVKVGEKREKMKWLYDIFTQETGISIPWNHPLSPQCFMEKAGTHQSQVVRDPKGYIPRKKLEYDLGGEVQFEAGQLMSKQVVKALLEGYDVRPELVEEVTNAIAARSALKRREVSPWEVKEIIEFSSGIKIPIEQVTKKIRGSDRVYIMLTLVPQFPVSELIREVGSWKEVDRIDEVYGDIDLIVLSQIKSFDGEEIVDKIRSRFKGAITKTITLPVE